MQRFEPIIQSELVVIYMNVARPTLTHWQREIFTTNIITALFLVQTLDHWTLITVWVNKPAKESAQGV